MKKMCLSMFAASVFFFSVQSVTGQSGVLEESALEQVLQSEFTEIAIEDLPAAVQQAVERDFPGALIAGAFVAKAQAGKTFKVVLKTADGEQEELFSDATGNWIDPQ